MIAGPDDDPDHLTAADRERAERRRTRPTDARPPRRRTTRSRTARRGSDPGTRKSRDGAAPEDRRIEMHHGAVRRRDQSRSAGDRSDAEQNQAGDPPPARQRATPDAGSSTAPGFPDRRGSRHTSSCVKPLPRRRTWQNSAGRSPVAGHPALPRPLSLLQRGPAGRTALGSQPACRSMLGATIDPPPPEPGRRPLSLNPRGAPRLQNVGALVANGTWVRLGGAISSDARPRRLLHCGQLRQQSGNKLQMAPTTPGHSALIPTRAARTLVTKCFNLPTSGPEAALKQHAATCTQGVVSMQKLALPHHRPVDSDARGVRGSGSIPNGSGGCVKSGPGAPGRVGHTGVLSGPLGCAGPVGRSGCVAFGGREHDHSFGMEGRAPGDHEGRERHLHDQQRRRG